MWGVPLIFRRAIQAIKPKPQPPKPKKMRHAIDLSKWNSTHPSQDGRDVNWNEIAQNVPMIDAAIFKASEGSNKVDPAFQRYVIGAVSKEIPWGAYHFATWNSNDEVADATQEARHFLKTLKTVPYPTYKIWLDVETNKTNIILNPQELVRYIQTFFAELEAQGYPNYGLYGSRGFLDSFLPRNHPFGQIPLWIAHYTNKPQPTLPHGWNTYELWQYTDQGICRGIKTRADLNRFAP